MFHYSLALNTARQIVRLLITVQLHNMALDGGISNNWGPVGKLHTVEEMTPAAETE